MAPTGFSATAILGKQGWAALPSPVALRLKASTAKAKINDRRYKSVRQPFNVTFIGPSSPLLKSATYRVSHPAWKQPLSIFLTRVSADKINPIYEAVFS
jgi:hypothetical protein